jgi:hypothetical protein
MISFLRRMVAPAALFASLLITVSSKATTVQYYTVGTFGGVNANATITNNTTAPTAVNSFQQISSVSVDSPPSPGGSSSLTYQNSSVFYGGNLLSWNVTTGPLAVNFGRFLVNSSSPNLDAFDGLTFTLAFFQLQPTVGTSSLLAASVTGVLSFNNPVVVSGSPTLTIDFQQIVTYIPDASTGVKYQIGGVDGEGKMIIQGGLANTATDLNGTISVPLPGIAVAGLWLLGGVGTVGGAKAFRRRALAVS